MRTLLFASCAWLASGCVQEAAHDPGATPSGKADLATACQNPLPGGVAPLSCVAVPQPTGTDIVDPQAAILLGKALFWDAQVASDGSASCASCHFHAGSDKRVINTLHPGPNQVFESGGVTAAGQTFRPSSITTDDRVGSQGISQRTFGSLPMDLTVAFENCTAVAQPPFGSQRQVTDRRTTTVMGAVFNRVQFRDGRAASTFNGVDSFGTTGNAAVMTALFEGASLASQAVAPPMNPIEMACTGRPFNGDNSLGAKLLPRQPLRFQYVDPQDSVLGADSLYPKMGLRCGDAGAQACTYQNLVTAAFGPTLGGAAREQFSRLFGQAIAAYLATLVPDQTRLDKYLAGDMTALTATQKQGLDLFTGKAGCVRCHAGPELSDASVSFAAANGLLNKNGGDQGFHNTGVRPTEEDLGRATAGPKGISYSVSGSLFDRGAFKTVQLRNLGERAPYFHNGGKATLDDVIDFYDRGGDFANAEKDPALVPLGLSADERAALKDFLQHGLTDCRVNQQSAPFDHPYLVPFNWTNIPQTGASGNGLQCD